MKPAVHPQHCDAYMPHHVPVILPGDGMPIVIQHVLLQVYIPDLKTVEWVKVRPHITAWAAREALFCKLCKDLPREPLNYGLYIPPNEQEQVGQYIEEEAQLQQYSEEEEVLKLELRYKARECSSGNSMDERTISKVNSKANQHKFMKHINNGSLMKVQKLLESGLDPNFITDNGDTPLGLACVHSNHLQYIAPLLSGGARMDFRGKGGLTPMHYAARAGNAEALETLISHGATINCRDSKGITPLHHVMMKKGADNTHLCDLLIRKGAGLNITDVEGWTELHQAIRYGCVGCAEMLIGYGADMNAQTMVGNTPLHVAASHGQVECAMLLLEKGADKTKVNQSNYTPAHVAILCGHRTLAEDINSFSPAQHPQNQQTCHERYLK